MIRTPGTLAPRRPAPAVLGLASLAVLGLAGCGGTAAGESTTPAGEAIAVTADDSSCAVATTTLPAGTHRFSVTNNGTKPTEFEIFADGDRILGEVENIAPGVARPLLVDLPPGRYQAACKPGMVGDGIRSDLTVTGSAAPASDSQQLAAAVRDYTGYVRQQVAQLQEQTRQFVDAVNAGDAARAKALYPVARSAYERIEPVAESFGDLDPKIDARENDVEPGATWTGFHVLEKVLWTGGDLGVATPVADRLVEDVQDLANRVQTLDLKPLDLANGALGLLDEVATTKITGEEDRYSHTDLYDIAANVAGSREAIGALRPVIAEHDPALAAELDRQFAAVQGELDTHRRGEGWASWTELSSGQLRALSDAVNALAAQVSKVPAVVAQ